MIKTILALLDFKTEFVNKMKTFMEKRGNNSSQTNEYVKNVTKAFSVNLCQNQLKKVRIYFNEHVSSLNVYRLTKLNACHSWISIIVSMATTIFNF